MITLRFSTVDGIRKTKRFKTLVGARKAAHDWVGKDAEVGRTYAVSADGVVKVTSEGCTLVELFSNESTKQHDFNPDSDYFKIRVGGQFIAKCFQFDCNAAEYIYTHQLDDVTYDAPDGSIGVMSCEIVHLRGDGTEVTTIPTASGRSATTDDEIPF